MASVRAAVAGATGYVGQELLRLLLQHPQATVTAVTSGSSSGKPLSEAVPRFTGVLDLPLVKAEPAALAAADVVFLALPHGEAASLAPRLLAGGARVVVDLSADFRFASAAAYKAAYGQDHPAPALLGEAVYGLPELFGKRLPGARLVGNPGCYPTGALLALAPVLGFLADRGIAAPFVTIDAKSGVSGAGKEPRGDLHFPEMNESVRAYSTAKHRHRPEIVAHLAGFLGAAPALTFTPHLVPANRGIQTTAVVPLPKGAAVSQADLDGALAGFAKGKPFLRLPGREPDTAAVRGANTAEVWAVLDKEANAIITQSAIDNLVKGAAGQAIQNMNLALGLPETAGLPRVGVVP